MIVTPRYFIVFTCSNCSSSNISDTPPHYHHFYFNSLFWCHLICASFMAPHLCLMCCLCLQPPSMSSTNIPGAFVIRENMETWLPWQSLPLPLSPLSINTLIAWWQCTFLHYLWAPETAWSDSTTQTFTLARPLLYYTMPGLILAAFLPLVNFICRQKSPQLLPSHLITVLLLVQVYVRTYDHHKHHSPVSPSLQKRIWSNTLFTLKSSLLTFLPVNILPHNSAHQQQPCQQHSICWLLCGWCVPVNYPSCLMRCMRTSVLLVHKISPHATLLPHWCTLVTHWSTVILYRNTVDFRECLHGKR